MLQFAFLVPICCVRLREKGRGRQRERKEEEERREGGREGGKEGKGKERKVNEYILGPSPVSCLCAFMQAILWEGNTLLAM